MLRTNIMSSLYRSPNWISAGGYIALGASPPTSGAIRVDAATAAYGNTVLAWKSATGSGNISYAGDVLAIQNISGGGGMQLVTNNALRWTVGAAASTSSLITA